MNGDDIDLFDIKHKLQSIALYIADVSTKETDENIMELYYKLKDCPLLDNSLGEREALDALSLTIIEYVNGNDIEHLVHLYSLFEGKNLN